MHIDVDALADEVAELCRRLDTARTGRELSNHTSIAGDRERLREIGDLAHQHGGTELMLQIVYLASWSYRNVIDTANAHWRGIGGWEGR